LWGRGAVSSAVNVRQAWDHGRPQLAAAGQHDSRARRPPERRPRQAFYMPWEELPRWAQLHLAEYGKAKILTLIGASRPPRVCRARRAAPACCPRPLARRRAVPKPIAVEPAPRTPPPRNLPSSSRRPRRDGRGVRREARRARRDGGAAQRRAAGVCVRGPRLLGGRGTGHSVKQFVCALLTRAAGQWIRISNGQGMRTRQGME
jgi:hypothetical protein